MLDRQAVVCLQKRDGGREGQTPRPTVPHTRNAPANEQQVVQRSAVGRPAHIPAGIAGTEQVDVEDTIDGDWAGCCQRRTLHGSRGVPGRT